MQKSPIDWIERNVPPQSCNSAEFFYDDMESQSGYCLPVIYQEFDLSRRGHWCDRGAMFDFLISTDGESRRLLDFGPGDGWPSLIVAPFVRNVVGVEGSKKRRQVCEENAARMKIDNAEFVYVESGKALPFGDDSFDGATAASSIEQTPDPKAVLAELRRVLKPGGRLRVMYEDLDRYRGGREQEAAIEGHGKGSSRLVLYYRDIPGEKATMFSLVTSLPAQGLRRILEQPAGAIDLASIKGRHLDALKPHITASRACVLSHPSGVTLGGWLREAGFSSAYPTRCGIDLARALFDGLPEGERPQDLEGLDRLLRPAVADAVSQPAPLNENPPITAVK